VGKALIIVGLVIAAVGILIQLGVPFGRLPGDMSAHSLPHFQTVT
jgi:hypothetical protein